MAHNVPGNPEQAGSRSYCLHGVPDVACPALASQCLKKLQQRSVAVNELLENLVFG